mmetsp:Transcript_7410/g.11070  ORF Transcript_7410/g.11070 Transcript_7410/m.11070 type:complete len:309 (-) Transcript_7410:318-1244(-)
MCDRPKATPEVMALFECSICLSLICDPITISCGHSFCRVCLIKTLSRTKKKCPECRAVCYSNAEDQPENVMLGQIVRCIYPEIYNERLNESKLEKSKLLATHPIFYYNLTLFPGQILKLCLFEKRYLLMIKRILNTTRKFAYVPNYSSYEAKKGDVAIIAEIKDCTFDQCGHCYITAHLMKRYIITDHFIEEDTHGLHYCEIKPLEDEPPSKEDGSRVDKLLKQLFECVKIMFEHEITNQHTDVPTLGQREKMSLFIAGILPPITTKKHELLTSTNTLKRLITLSMNLLKLGHISEQTQELANTLESL